MGGKLLQRNPDEGAGDYQDGYFGGDEGAQVAPAVPEGAQGFESPPSPGRVNQTGDQRQRQDRENQRQGCNRDRDAMTAIEDAADAALAPAHQWRSALPLWVGD